MGQAVVELPDPLENGDVANAASADDLLAQLASEEIDRLLAEAESEQSPLPPWCVRRRCGAAHHVKRFAGWPRRRRPAGPSCAGWPPL